MEEVLSFEDKIERALIKKQDFLNREILPKLKETLQSFLIFYENLFKTLLRKGFIQEDPYKYDEKISEVSTPSDEPFIDSEKQEKMNQRLSSYHTQLEFLNNYYQISLEFLNLNRIKRIIDLLNYINWSQLTITAAKTTTRCLAEYIEKLKRGSDTLSVGIMSDSLNQIEKLLKTALTLLREVSIYNKEFYKLETRKNIISKVDLDSDATARKENFLKKIKKIFVQQYRDFPFYPDLIEEIFDEDYSSNVQELRNKVLQKLEVKAEKKKKKKTEDVNKNILIQAIRYLASCGLQVEDSLAKLTDNQQVLESRKLSLGERFVRWLKKIVSGKGKEKIYEIEYFDVATSTTRSEKVNFNLFIDEIQKMARLFSAITTRVSQFYRRLEASTEEKLYSFLNKNLINLQLCYRRMNGLVTFFKSETARDRKVKIRGIKLELNAIKNSIVKANQKKHEYVARKEEEEQMKKLGIKTQES